MNCVRCVKVRRDDLDCGWCMTFARNALLARHAVRRLVPLAAW